MKKLIEGLDEFRANYYLKNQELFEQLAHGQKPRVLFVTCSDSRIDPNLLTQTEIGELFVIRNAGNIIPPYGAANGGEGAAVEYAIHALGIEQIIVCGHSHCGAMKGLLKLNKLQEEMPLVYDWLQHAEATRRLVKESYTGYPDEELLEITIAENVLTQIENLETYPVVHSKLYQGKLQIYGWVYLIETGEILAYDAETHAYVPPQSLLPEQNPEGRTLRRGQYISTSAPPVACEVPPLRLNSAAKAAATTTKPNAAKPAASRAPGVSPAQSKPSQNGHSGWLAPEQADRIYRGSYVRKS